jgi:hypothetical protein
MTARQRDLLRAIDAGEVHVDFSTCGELCYRWKGSDTTAAVKELMDACWAAHTEWLFEGPPYRPVVIALTYLGREALRAAEAAKARG